ncbi:MAG TPA: hypothetical protein VKV79_04475, partial [Terriglobia bacterium]|nr:hypothetical protein [Terriglobia bacterium]
MKRLYSMFGLVILSFGLIVCWAVRGCAAQKDESAEIAALKQRVAAQDRRISELEREVQQLLAVAHHSPATSQVPGTPPHKAVEAVKTPAAAPQAMAAAKNAPKIPKIRIAGINVGGDVYLYQYVP